MAAPRQSAACERDTCWGSGAPTGLARRHDVSERAPNLGNADDAKDADAKGKSTAQAPHNQHDSWWGHSRLVHYFHGTHGNPRNGAWDCPPTAKI